MTCPDDLRAAVVARIRARLDARPRPADIIPRLTIPQVIDCVRAVVEGQPYRFISAVPAADRPAWPWPGPWTTVAMAARVEGRIYLGIRVVPIYMAAPGRCWSFFGSWREGDAAAWGESVWGNWTERESVMALEDPEVDLLLEGEVD